MSHMLYGVASREIMHNVYQWSAIEIEDDEVIGCEIKIFQNN